MNIEDFFNIFDYTTDLALRNSSFIELLEGYCEAKDTNDCNPEALLKLIEIVKKNNTKLILELEKDNLLLYNELKNQGCLEE